MRNVVSLPCSQLVIQVLLFSHALKGDGSVPKPSMSWSVPFGWLFAMPERCQPDKARPSPVEVKDIKELKILEGFVEEK